MGDLANCTRCNAIFIKGTAAVCPECRKKEEEDFQVVYSYMRKKQNRMATVEDIEADTGVAEKQIREFVKQKRLHPAQFPNMAYGCEKCGSSIREGRLCEGCKGEIASGLQKQEQNDSMKQRQKDAELKKANRTYYSVRNEQ
ncbi:TIGR03826 family flagellar region protein [Halobacillus litoralis]|uniref:Flagellar protein YvyF n=1 Tax=Halobacillus litoralis TaxID=45668 RepID=A0A410MG41_9BACI|nr:TIGR03826 family flagellar region protein [Halobacillus litoralis]QAS53699.1 flagellar protein YvyF [Halobacillus litoralis]